MNKNYQKNLPAGKNAGFTLIELLVVVLIIGILAAIALPKYEFAVQKARAAEAMILLKKMGDNIDMCMLANGNDFSLCSDPEIMADGVEAAIANSKNFTYHTDQDAPLAMNKQQDYMLGYMPDSLGNKSFDRPGGGFVEIQLSAGRYCIGQTEKGESFCKKLSQGGTPIDFHGMNYYPF